MNKPSFLSSATPPWADATRKKSKLSNEMPSFDLECELGLNSDVDRVVNFITQYIENHPAAYNEVLAAVQITQPKPLATPASTPRQEPNHDGQADQHKNSFIDPHNQSSLAAKQELSQGGRPSHIEDADDSGIKQTSDNSQGSTSLDIWPLSDHNTDTVSFSIPHQLDIAQHTPPKRKQHFEDGSASKRVHVEPGDAIEGVPRSSSPRYLTVWSCEEFALRYYMLVPSSSRTSENRDMANQILTKVLGASRSEGFNKYQLGLTEIFFRADVLVLLENLRRTRLDHCATMIQKNLKAKYYRRKYLKARKAILLMQSISRRHLAWKHTEEIRRIKAATTIQRAWRGQKQRKSFNAIRNNVILIQAAAKGFLRRREIMDTVVGKVAVLIQRSWRGKCARRRYEKIRQAVASSDAEGQGDHGNDRFAKLPAHWRTQLQRIKSIEVLEDCQRFCYMARNPVTSIDVRPDQDALEGSGGPDKVPTRYRRVKQLRFLIEDVGGKEKAIKAPKWALQVLKRMHLAELTAKYEAEKAATRKRGQPFAKQRFTDLLFPHTIGYKSKKAKKGGRGKKGEKGKKREGGNKEQMSGEEIRRSAEKTFEYWNRLGKPLWAMSERYGLPLLTVLPKELTESSLAELRMGQDQDVVNYIDLYHPGLKEQISNLSSFLPGITPPSKYLVIETIPHHELLDHSFEELFQFSNISASPKRSDLSEEQSRLSQIPIDNVDTRQADAALCPSPDQGQANEQISYTQGTREAVKNDRPDYTSESLRSRSLSADIEDGNPSNSITDYGEFAHLSEKSDSRELNQQINRNLEDPSSFQNVVSSAQLQPCHNWGDLNPQDYYDQGGDWREQPFEGEFPDSKDGDLQQSDLSEVEFSDLDSFINYSPLHTPSIASVSQSQPRGRDLSAHLVDMPRASTPLQCPSAASHNPDAGTVNPKDLLRISV